MRLKRLELQGFKSFVDRTIVHFESRITGVVGPNGCGKSNIVDAILWVMGEQSAKHLRGESMTDVIFNGSENRSPTSMAEVSLILDKQGVLLSPQFAAFDTADEISITRRIYRDGQGEYLINKQMCRLKDIHELFMDTGVGRRAYSIIEQGQIDRMINVKPEERRHLFEEVAGITKYKAKKKEAEKKLESTEQNLLRLRDITSELEKQMRSLKIQATRARKYKEIKAELETVDLHLIGRKLYQLDKQILKCNAHRDTLIETRSSLDARTGEIDAQTTESEIQRLDVEKAFQTANDSERSLAIALEKLDGNILVYSERSGFIRQNSGALQEELNSLSSQLETLEIELARVTDDWGRLNESLSASRSRISEHEQSKQSSQLAYSGLLEKKLQTDEQSQSVAIEDQRMQGLIDHGAERENSLKTGQVMLNDKLTGIVVELDAKKAGLEDADRKIGEVGKRYGEAETETAQIASHCQITSAQLSNTEDELFAERETYHRRTSRLQSLEELSKNLEGYLPTAREIRNKIEGTTALPLAEIVQPESAVEEHLEHILGNDINTLLTDTVEQAKHLAAVIQDSGLERVGIVSAEALGADLAQQSPRNPIDGVQRLISQVRVVPGYAAVAEHYLGNVYLCADRESLFALRAQHPGSTFISSDGKLVARNDGSFTCGVTSQHSGIFSRRREMESLQSECAQLKSHVDGLTADYERLLKLLESQETEHEDLKTKLSSIHIERIELRKEKEKIQIEYERSDRDYQESLHQSQENLTQLDAIREQLTRWRRDSDTLKANRLELLTVQSGITGDIESERSRLENISSALEDLRVEISALSERVNLLEFQRRKAAEELGQGKRRVEYIHEQSARDERELESIGEQESQAVRDREQKTFERGKIVESLNELKTQFETVSNALQQLREDRDKITRDKQTAQEELQQIELHAQQEESDRSHLQTLAMERYHRNAPPISEFIIVPLERIPLLADQLTLDWLSMELADRERLMDEHLTNLRQKADRYGEVNLTAIQEFEEIEGRSGFLNKQKEDLDHAVAVLKEAILKIDETTKVRFEETFHVVNAKFKEIFPILFNGGTAELSLTVVPNGVDPGIDVMVQPPGKRLQSMSLLSGGEKALTAVSLILSIFARKPSPFCLLDEVDAPLDDANVARFNTVIRKMSQKTQFIVITHNKKTMEMAEALYGVTMERAGVSKMTSVRLS